MTSPQETTIPAIIREIAAHPVYADALQAGVDVERIVIERFDTIKTFTLATAVNFAASHIKEAIRSASDTILKGLVVGQYDRYGWKMPRKYALIQSDCDHKTLTVTEATRIEPPASVEIRAQKDPKYSNYRVTNRISVTPLPRDEVVTRLLQVSTPAPKLDFNAIERYQMIVVTGTIRWISASSRFDDGARVGSNPVWLSTEDSAPERFVPVIDIALDRNNARVSVTASLGRQAYGRPIYDVPDIDEICKTAATLSTDPTEQSVFVRTGLAGRNVVVVGEVAYKRSADSGDYVTLNVYAMYQFDPNLQKPARLDMADAATVAPPATVQTSSQAPVQAPTPAPAQAPAAATAYPLAGMTTGAAPSLSRAEIETAIRKTATVLDVPVSSLTTDQVRVLHKIPTDVEDSVLASVLRVVQSMAVSMTGDA
jgi:hypothetical protein